MVKERKKNRKQYKKGSWKRKLKKSAKQGESENVKKVNACT